MVRSTAKPMVWIYKSELLKIRFLMGTSGVESSRNQWCHRQIAYQLSKWCKQFNTAWQIYSPLVIGHIIVQGLRAFLCLLNKQMHVSFRAFEVWRIGLRGTESADSEQNWLLISRKIEKYHDSEIIIETPLTPSQPQVSLTTQAVLPQIAFLHSL